MCSEILRNFRKCIERERDRERIEKGERCKSFRGRKRKKGWSVQNLFFFSASEKVAL